MALQRLAASPLTRHSVLRSYSTASSPTSSVPLKRVALGALAAGGGVVRVSTLLSSNHPVLANLNCDTFDRFCTSSGPTLNTLEVPQIDQLKDKASKAVTTSALSSDEWRNLKLEKVIPYNHNTSTFVFELPKGTDSGLHVASALLTKSAASEGEMACTDDKGKPPVTPPEQKDTLHLLVKKYPTGKMTNHIFSLKPGDQLAMKGPIPKWPYKPNEFKAVGMIAGGSGITPHWQIIQEIASNPADKTKVVLLFANQKEEDILLRQQFERLAKQNPEQFSIHFALDQPPKNWPSELKGFLTKDVLKSKLPSPSLGSEVKIFVCGPPGQVAAVAGPKKGKEQGELSGILKELGFNQDQVFKF